MHTEHLQNVGVMRVITGWLIAIAVTSVVVLAAFSFGMLDASDSVFWPAAAVAVGFAAGGFVIGVRASEAPILHGVGIGLMSIVAWAVLNLATMPFGGENWAGLSAATAVLVILEQILAAVLGARLGYLLALRGTSEAAEDVAERPR